MFQQGVLINQGAGVPGDIVIDGPQRGNPGRLASADPSTNVVGSFVRLISGTEMEYATDVATGDGIVWGIIANSKEYALYGNAGDPLGASLVLPNGMTADLITMTSGILTTLTNASVPGSAIFINDADGTVAASTDLATPTAPVVGTWTRVQGASVVRTINAAGLATIQLNGYLQP